MMRVAITIAGLIAVTGMAHAAGAAPPPLPDLALTSPINGDFSFYTGVGRYVETGFNSNGGFGVVGGDAHINDFLKPSFSVQGDLQAETTSVGFSSCCAADDHRSFLLGAAHLSWRDSVSHLVGVFGGLDDTTVLDAAGHVTQGFVGGEAQKYKGNWTFYGQAGYTWNTESSNYGQNLWFVRGVVRFFLRPNNELEAELGYASGNYFGGEKDDGDQTRNLSWGLSYEQRFGAGPFSAFARYSGFSNAELHDEGYRSIENQVVFGVSMNFGNVALLDVDRSGATLDLPNIVRPLAWTQENY